MSTPTARLGPEAKASLPRLVAVIMALHPNYRPL